MRMYIAPELRNDIMNIAHEIKVHSVFLIIGFAMIIGLCTWWLNSPEYALVSPRAQAVNALITYYYTLPEDIKADWMAKYNISDDEVNPSKVLRRWRNN